MSPGANESSRPAADHFPVAVDVGGDDRRRGCEGPGYDHPEALAPERGRGEELRASELGVEGFPQDGAEQIDSGVVEAAAGDHEPDGERVGADDAEPRPGVRVDVRPGREQYRESLARLVAADEHHRVGPASRGAARRDADTVWDQREGSRRIGLGRAAGGFGDGDPDVDPLEQEAPRGHRAGPPARRSGRVKGGNDGYLGEGERRGPDRRGERLVQMEQVETLIGEGMFHAPEDRGAE